MLSHERYAQAVLPWGGSFPPASLGGLGFGLGARLIERRCRGLGDGQLGSE